ncbi:MAG: hypothetical protein OHK0045_24180 [Raineya sp.]
MSEAELRLVSEAELRLVSEAELRLVSEAELRLVSEAELRLVSEAELRSATSFLRYFGQVLDNLNTQKAIFAKNLLIFFTKAGPS